MGMDPHQRAVLMAVNSSGQVYIRNMPQQRAALAALAEGGYLQFNPTLEAYSITEKGEEALRR
jgi:hypothetical protein